MRAYRLLLHLFPASFRLEYGEEMCSVFARRRRDASGPLAMARLWLAALADVAANAARVHGDLLRQDLRFAARTLRRSPGFAAAAIAVAALGVGVTTAAFSITDHVLVRPLPFAHPSRLVMLWQAPASGGLNEASPANYRGWKGMSASFESMGAYRRLSLTLLDDGDPEQLEAAALTADLLPTLGRGPLLGRPFSESDAREGAPATALIGHALWRTRFAGDPGVVGRTVRLSGEAHTIVGVMPADFRFPDRQTQAWTALRLGERDFEDRTDTYLYVVARRRQDVALERARAEMSVVAAQLERAHPRENARSGISVRPLRDHVSGQARTLLMALLGASLCVLLIACTNLAGLLVARGAFRRQELAVRTALGAGRERLVRQLVTESLALAACGGAVGVMLAGAAVPLVARLVPNALPVAETPPLDLRLLGFAALLTTLTGIGFGVLPAVSASAAATASGLREGARGGSRSERLRRWLVVGEVAVSVVLLVGAGLLIRALWRIQQVDPGFRAEHVLTLRTALPLPRYEKVQARHDFYSRVLERARALPGVTAAAYVTGLPMVMRGGIWSVEVPGEPREPGMERPASLRFVTPGFFATLRIPLHAGRDVTPSDARGAPFVAVVSESFARRHWPGQDPLGRRFRLAAEERIVVGVVGDVRVRGLERASEPQVYLPHAQMPDGGIVGYIPRNLVVRSVGDPTALVSELRRAVAQADPQQPISDVRTLADVLAADTAPRAVQARVLAGFAGAAVLLAAIGIHGLLAFVVSKRRHEIGVRLALGARPASILTLILRQGVVLAAAGIAAGLVAAYGAGRALQALLAGTRPHDPAVFGAALALVSAATLAGALWPALRASRLDPLTVLRAE